MTSSREKNVTNPTSPLLRQRSVIGEVSFFHLLTERPRKMPAPDMGTPIGPPMHSRTPVSRKVPGSASPPGKK